MMKPICCLIVLLSYCEIVLSGTAVRPSIAAEGKAEEPLKVIGLMLEQMDKYHSFSYDEEMLSWNPGEKETDSTPQTQQVLEVVDGQEPYVGARYVCTGGDNQGFFAYDGKKRIRSTQEPKVFEVDSLFKGITAYRVVARPFFQVAATIGRYVLSTSDSITLEMQETELEYRIKVSIFTDEQVEFAMGRLSPYVPEVPAAGIFFTPPHVYILHIDKSTYMPVRYYRILDHNSSMVQVSKVKYDTCSLDDFDICAYLPADFTFYNRLQKKTVKPKLKRGDSAPDFELQDTEGTRHRLSQYRGKTVLVEFTSVACSVCQIVPTFLHRLSEEFPRLQILSVEAWDMKAATCTNWVRKKGVTHPYLLNGKGVYSSYTDKEVVPSFFLIDAEGKIVAEFVGYQEKTTPSAIREEIARIENLD